MWECFKGKILNIISDHIPTKQTSTKFHQPWITSETKRMLRKKEKWYIKSKNCNSSRVPNKYKSIKKSCQNLCRKAHSNYVKYLLEDDKNNKKLYSYIRSKNNENVGIADLIEGNKIIQDPSEKANLFNKHFSSVFL